MHGVVHLLEGAEAPIVEEEDIKNVLILMFVEWNYVDFLSAMITGFLC